MLPNGNIIIIIIHKKTEIPFSFFKQRTKLVINKIQYIIMSVKNSLGASMLFAIIILTLITTNSL